MASNIKSTARFQKLTDTGYHPVDDDTVGLLRPIRKASRPSLWRRVFFIAATVVVISLAWAGGLATEWKARLLSNRFGGETAASSSSALLVGPELGDIGNLTMPARQGTSFNAPALANFTEDGFFLGRPPGGDGFDTTPVTPIPSAELCINEYAYRSQLGFDGTPPLSDLVQLDGRLDRDDVRQGPLGNCGFIAALLAMICSGREEQLKSTIMRVGKTLEVRFRSPVKDPRLPSAPLRAYRTDVFEMDDTIPFCTLSEKERQEKNCWKFLAAYPGEGPGATPADASRAVMFVPLLEKAWAIYTDANPDLLRPQLKDDPTLVGYPGLEGSLAHLALQSLTGLEGGSARRSRIGFDHVVGGLLNGCIAKPCPIVLGTPNAEDLDLVGVKTDKDAVIENEIGTIATNKNDRAYFDVAEKDTGRVFTLVGTHAYAIDNANSQVAGDNVTLDDAEVTIINPWGANPDASGRVVLPASLQIRLKTLAFVMDSVFLAT